MNRKLLMLLLLVAAAAIGTALLLRPAPNGALELEAAPETAATEAIALVEEIHHDFRRKGWEAVKTRIMPLDAELTEELLRTLSALQEPDFAGAVVQIPQAGPATRCIDVNDGGRKVRFLVEPYRGKPVLSGGRFME